MLCALVSNKYRDAEDFLEFYGDVIDPSFNPQIAYTNYGRRIMIDLYSLGELKILEERITKKANQLRMYGGIIFHSNTYMTLDDVDEEIFAEIEIYDDYME